MVLQLHVWGPAFGLPSIDAECIACIGYLNHIVPRSEWTLVSDYDTLKTPQGEFPLLVDGASRVTGFENIVTFLKDRTSSSYDLDGDLNVEQLTEKTAFTTLLRSAGTPLIDLYLYVSSANYNAITSSSYTAILPWYLNYTIPPARRDLARLRTAHLGLSSLDVQVEDRHDGVGLGNDFEAAKRAAGLPAGGRAAQPEILSMGRGKGFQGLLSSPIYAARFKLDALANELLEPLSDALGKTDYLLAGDRPSSLDCLAFGYLALMLYPTIPQAWLREAIETRFPRILSYISRVRENLIGVQKVDPADVWRISDKQIQKRQHLPWQPHSTRPSLRPFILATREVLTVLPGISIFTRSATQIHDTRIALSKPSSLPSNLTVNFLIALSGTVTAAFIAMATHHRRSPREGELIFWAIRPQTGFGEAGNILSVLANQLPRAPAAGF